MNPSDATKQIRQMVNFILQEAQEKANEIRIKTEHDFNLEKQMLVHNAKLKIQDEFAKREKDREVQKRIKRSAEIGASRRKKMSDREELLQVLLQEARQRAAVIRTDRARYTKFIQDLLVQGLIKIDEKEVFVRSRPDDVDIVEAVIPTAVAEYKKIMQKECGYEPQVKVQAAAKNELLSTTTCSGGIVLSAYQGRILCNNTIEARMELIYYDRKPEVRSTLFPAQAAPAPAAPQQAELNFF